MGEYYESLIHLRIKETGLTATYCLRAGFCRIHLALASHVPFGVIGLRVSEHRQARAERRHRGVDPDSIYYPMNSIWKWNGIRNQKNVKRMYNHVAFTIHHDYSWCYCHLGEELDKELSQVLLNTISII